MTSTSTAAAEMTPEEPAPGRRLPAMRKRTVLVVVGLVVVWLVGGLGLAVLTIQQKAGVAQHQLEAFQASLKSGDQQAAASHLSRGRTALRIADEAAGSVPVRLAGLVPGVGDTLSDVNHLLAAADIMSKSGADALGLYNDFSGADSQLFRHSRFSLSALARAQRSVDSMGVSMTRAKHELDQVSGLGPKGSLALAKKQTALAQIDGLQKQIADAKPAIDALPSAVGAVSPKTYLVAVLNPAEMRASGGAPLSVAFVHFDKGRMTIPLKGTTSVITTGNVRQPWSRLPTDPWQTTAKQRFVNANFNPSFPVSGEELTRATPNTFGMGVDGVISLDVVAISHLLKVTGPIKSPEYGPLDAENLVQKLIKDAYNISPEASVVAQRHEGNDQLMSIMLTRLTDGGGLVGKARALGEAVPGRHLQLYFHDERLQQLVLDKHLGGAIAAPELGNLSAVYTQNTNGSKMDVFQQRTVRETMRLRADGSAVVRRSVEITNKSPKYLATGPDQKVGYDTRWAGNQVITLMPKGAQILHTPVSPTGRHTIGVTGIDTGTDQDGRIFGQARVLLPPGASTTLTWTYLVPKAAALEGSTLHLLDYVEPQSMLDAPSLELTVVPPKGWSIQPTPGWAQTATGDATITVAMDAPKVLALAASAG